MRSNVTPETNRWNRSATSSDRHGAARRILHRLIIVSLLFIIAACQPDGKTWERIQRSGVLRVGLDPTFPPFENDDGQGLDGLDVDLARALADDLGLQVEFTYFGYDGLYDALAADKVDVLISALVIVPGRMRDFAYSDSYYDAGEILIMAADAVGIESKDDLSGHTLAVELGARGHVEATSWERRLTDLVIRPYNSSAEAMAAVAAEEADVALVDSVSGRLYLMTRPGLRRSERPATSEPYAMVVRADDMVLLTKLNERLADLRSSGRLEQIVSKWLGV